MPWNRRAELLDIESQAADHNAAMRDEHHAAARHDRRTLININGTLHDLDDIPHPSDVADLGD